MVLYESLIQVKYFVYTVIEIKLGLTLHLLITIEGRDANDVIVHFKINN